MELPPLSIDSVSTVLKGSLNPAIFSPAWLLMQKLIGQSEHDAAEVDTIRPEISQFKTGWLSLTCTRDTLQLFTDSPEEFERCRDVMIGILRALNHTPANYLGINRQVHFLTHSEDAYHAIGDALVPKNHWEGLLILPGLRLLTMQGIRPDHYGGAIFVRVEPSQTIEQAVYVAHNDHFALKVVGKQPTSRSEFSMVKQDDVEPSSKHLPIAMRVLLEEWPNSMARAEAAIAFVASLGHDDPQAATKETPGKARPAKQTPKKRAGR